MTGHTTFQASVDRAIQEVHHESLDHVVRRMRTNRKTWDCISRRITMMSNIDVSRETLRQWYSPFDQDLAAPD